MEDIVSLLQKNILTIKFTKRDGSEREMLCTLMDEYIPPVSGTSVPRDGLVTVFDLEIDEWRSIRLDSIKEIYNDLGESPSGYN